MFIRQANANDAEVLKDLYFNHLYSYPTAECRDINVWREKLSSFEKNKNYNIFVLESNGNVVSSVTLIIIENLTNNMRPYALIENVVTHCDYQGKGLASVLLNHVCEFAKKANCYKIMLLTGTNEEKVLNFYNKNGFKSEKKIGFSKDFRIT